MRLRSWSSLLVTATVVLAVASYSLADRFLSLALGAIPLVIMGWYVVDVRGWAVTRRPLSDILVLATIVWSGYRVRSVGWVQGLTVSVFCEFLVAIILIKVWDRKHSRDAAQILTLSVFLSVGSMLTGASLWVAVLLALNVGVLLVTVMVFHLAAGIERAGIHPDGTDASRLGIGPRARRDFAASLLFTVIFGLAISAVVFLVMPRGIGLGQLGQFGQPPARRTGLTDRVDLTQSGLISESPRIALEARFEDSSHRPIGAEGRVFYLRAAVLDEYSLGSWHSSRGKARSDFERGPGAHLNFGAPGVQGIWQRITMHDAGSPAALPHVYRAVDFAFDQSSVYKVVWAPEPWGPETVSRPDGGWFRYIAASAPPRLPDKDDWPRETTTTFSVARVGAIAQTVLRDAGVEPDPTRRPAPQDMEACRAVERFLRTKFTYTLSPGAATPGTDPIEWFLTDGKAGHCEYFASAMAGMCRSVGINSRVIAGYVAVEFNEAEDSYTVRDSNAHAWVEAELAPGVWWTFDPSPQDTLRARMKAPSSLAARWARWLDHMDEAWSTSFISFDESSRRRLLGFSTDAEPWLRTTLARYRARFNEEGWRAAVPVIVNAAFATIAACFVAITLLRLARVAASRLAARLKRRSALRADPQLAHALGHTEFFGRMLALLRKRGMPKPAWRPPLDHAAEVLEREPKLGRAAQLATELYYRARFGRLPPGEEELGAVHRALDEAARL